MEQHKLLNQLLTDCSLVVRRRHMPDVADVLKQAAVLVNSVLRNSDDEIIFKVKNLIGEFEAKIVNDKTVTAQDLVMNVAVPAEADPEETFEPLQDEVEEPQPEPEVEDEEEEDFLAELDDELAD